MSLIFVVSLIRLEEKEQVNVTMIEEVTQSLRLTGNWYNIIALVENPRQCKLSRRAMVFCSKSFYCMVYVSVLLQVLSCQPRM